jgi:hypothetical protein
MEWQPIATAPRDGTIMLIFDGKDQMVCRYDVDFQIWNPVWGSDTKLYFNDGYDNFNMAGTHPLYWMPLPEPPK